MKICAHIYIYIYTDMYMYVCMYVCTHTRHVFIACKQTNQETKNIVLSFTLHFTLLHCIVFSSSLAQLLFRRFETSLGQQLEGAFTSGAIRRQRDAFVNAETFGCSYILPQWPPKATPARSRYDLLAAQLPTILLPARSPRALREHRWQSLGIKDLKCRRA